RHLTPAGESYGSRLGRRGEKPLASFSAIGSVRVDRRNMTSATYTSTTSASVAVDRVAKEIHGRISPWLQTREGVAAAGLAAMVFCLLWAAVSAPLHTDLLAAAFAVVLVSL